MDQTQALKQFRFNCYLRIKNIEMDIYGGSLVVLVVQAAFQLSIMLRQVEVEPTVE